MAKGRGAQAATTAVFIDSRVPDLQSLIAGAKPGENVFVVDPTQDGLAQIVADLAGADLTNLAAISIVAHGAPGDLQLGSTTLDDGDLSAHKAALREIGAALGHKGKLDLYACDVAAGAAGKAFIADLSRAAGGADVSAATHDIGKTASGENWTLDASTGAKPNAAATPFTAAAVKSYQGTLAAPPDGQLIGVAPYGQTNAQSYYLNSNSTTLQAVSTDGGSDAVAVDTTLGTIFELKYIQSPGASSADFHDALYIGGLSANAPASVMSTSFESYYDAHFETDTENGDTETGSSIAVDTADHELFIPIGSDITSENGLLVMSYSANAAGTVTVEQSSIHFLETNSGTDQPAQPAGFNNGAVYDYKTGNVYIDDVNGYYPSQPGNGIFKISVSGTGSAAKGGQPVAVVDASNLDAIQGLAFDAVHDRLFFATSQETTSGDPTTYVNNLYMLANPDTSNSTTAPTALSYSGVAAPKFGSIVGVAYDDNSNVLYVTNDYYSGNFNDPQYQKSEIDALQLNPAGTEVTGVTKIPYSSLSSTTPGYEPFGSLTYDPLSTLTVAGTTTSAGKGTPLTLLAGAPTITDFDSGGFLQSASVTITDASTGAAVSGDTLGLDEGGVFKTFTSTPTVQTDNGHTFNVSYSGGVLSVANQPGSLASGMNSENTIAAYQQVLQDVQYENNSTDTNARTVTFQVNNGAIGNPSGSTNTQSFNVAIAQPPTIVAGDTYDVPADVVAGDTATAAAPGALTGDSDPNGGTLSITGVETSGGTSGTVGSGLAGTYGTLTLDSDGSYSYAASNTSAIDAAPTGSHPVDDYTFTVTNAGGSETETFAATIDRAPTGTGITVTAPEGATTSGAAGAALANDTDADGDALTVASVSYTDSTNTTTTGTVGQPIDGEFGTLTLNADGSFSYAATNTLNYTTASVTGQPTIDDFTYTVSDGEGGVTSPETLQVDVTCFTTGTRIRTTRGDVAVEDLVVGDRAVTACGGARPITWIGHRMLDCATARVPSEVWPVRIRAGAFGIGACGDAVPERELRLSPGHPVLIGSGANERLVPIMCLINGTSIERVEVPAVTYWHVELDEHDILLAEGLPAESFLDFGNRPWFGPDAAAHALANPDFVVPGLGARCRPVAVDGPMVEAERRRLDALFATSLAAASAWPTATLRWPLEGTP